MFLRLSMPLRAGFAVGALGLCAVLAGPASAMGTGTLTFASAELRAAYPAGMPILSFTLTAPQMAASGASARSQNGQITVTKLVDKSSPLLFQLLTRGGHMEGMKLVADGRVLTFSDVLVSRIVASSDNETPKESVTFSFRALEINTSTPAPAIDRAMMAPPPLRAPVIPAPTKSP